MKRWDDISEGQQIERWENMLRVLNGLSPHERHKHWNMVTWGEKTECGTVACAAGHCGLDPWFRRRGFQLNFNPYTSSYWDEKTRMEVEVKSYTKDIGDAGGFFGVEGAAQIFFSSGTVSQVIKRVEKYIKHLRKMASV